MTAAVPETVSGFYNRPFRVIHGEWIARTILAAAKDPDVRRIAEGPLIGGVDQLSSSTDLRRATLREKRRALYD